MVCVGNTQVGRTPSGQWYNQEHHAGTTTGILTDFKQGLVHAVDPSKVLGSWSIGGTGNCDVSYDYGGGHIYTYNVWRNGTNYTFCKISGPAVPPSNFTIPSTQIFGSVSPASCGAAP